MKFQSSGVFVCGKWQAGLMDDGWELQEGDKLRVEYDTETVSFFLNEEVNPRNTAPAQGKVRPITYFSGRGSVKMQCQQKAQTVKKRLVVTCKKGAATDARAETASCGPNSPCRRCTDAKKKLMDALALDFDRILMECTKEVASVQHRLKWQQIYEKSADTLFPAASEERNMDGRVVAAINRLPASLLAEPQCCQRLTAAVSCLAAASTVLPLVGEEFPLALGTRFLVPPFEELVAMPHLLRCVELLEQGTASKYQLMKTDRVVVEWDLEGNPDNQFLELDSKTNAISYLEGAPDYCIVLSVKPITKGRKSFHFVMHKIGDEQWCGVTADKSVAGCARSLRKRSRCWTYYCGSRHHDKGRVTVETEEKDEVKHVKDGDTIGLVVDFGTRTLQFSLNDQPQATCNFPSDVSELYLVTELDYTDDCVELRYIPDKVADKQQVTRKALTMDRAIESVPIQDLQKLSTWEARVFGSLCVSPYKVSIPSGDLALNRLAAGDLKEVTLLAADLTPEFSAFLASFAARCCKNLVRVTVERGGEKGGAQKTACNLILRPEGGLDEYVKNHISQSVASASSQGKVDRQLILSDMGLDVPALQLLMEAALAALPQGAAPNRKDVEATENDDDSSSSGTPQEEQDAKDESSQEETPSKSAKRAQLLAKTIRSVENMYASEAHTGGERVLDSKRMAQSIELNQNPLVGAGQALSMKLMVQIAHLAAGPNLLRFDLDNNHIQDQAIEYLSRAFIHDRFAPRLEVLWLSRNRISDKSVPCLCDAFEKSLHNLIEIRLFKNLFSTAGETTLRQKTSYRTSLTLIL